MANIDDGALVVDKGRDEMAILGIRHDQTSPVVDGLQGKEVQFMMMSTKWLKLKRLVLFHIYLERS
jgi:hypothetical protein